MQTAEDYQVLGTDWQTDKKIDCCTKDGSETPPCCDCCYDTWTLELKNVSKEYNKVNEQANQINDQYKYIVIRRDKFKMWYDDLTKANDLAKTVCDQFEVIISQIEKICTNSGKAVDAIEILFCMLRDFYMQIDYLVSRYNELQNCIKCLNSSELTPGGGILKCLDMYFEKVDALVKTRNDLIKEI